MKNNTLKSMTMTDSDIEPDLKLSQAGSGMYAPSGLQFLLEKLYM
jgi:hypothetical protein